MHEFKSVTMRFEGSGPWTLPDATDVRLITAADATAGDRDVALLQLTFARPHPTSPDKPLRLYLKLSTQQATDLAAAIDSVAKLRNWPEPHQGMALHPIVD